MKIIKLIIQATLIAIFALYALHAHAQTMGEYAATTASVASGASSAGTSIGSGDLGGSSTWGANSVGASFDERASAMSGSPSGDCFEARAGGSRDGSDSESRWPQSKLDGSNGGGSDRFAESEDRFGGDQDRFPQRNLSDTSNRFDTTGRFNDNKTGLDTTYSSTSGLDKSYSSDGEDTLGTTAQP